MKQLTINGGMKNIIDQTGLKVSDKAEIGDIVLVKITTVKSLAGLFTGDSVIFRTENGILEINSNACEIERIWNV